MQRTYEKGLTVPLIFVYNPIQPKKPQASIAIYIARPYLKPVKK